jgi:hypothetical protein
VWNRIEMRTALASALKAASPFVRFLACLTSVAMLLTFPALKSHDFAEHLRTHEVRRSIVRHTMVAPAEEPGFKRAMQIALQPARLPFLIVDFAPKIAPIDSFESALQTLPTNHFLRLKLRLPRAGGEVPLS